MTHDPLGLWKANVVLDCSFHAFFSTVYLLPQDSCKIFFLTQHPNTCFHHHYFHDCDANVHMERKVASKAFLKLSIEFIKSGPTWCSWGFFIRLGWGKKRGGAKEKKCCLITPISLGTYERKGRRRSWLGRAILLLFLGESEKVLRKKRHLINQVASCLQGVPPTFNASLSALSSPYYKRRICSDKVPPITQSQ